jgi:hypothetical protein
LIVFIRKDAIKVAGFLLVLLLLQNRLGSELPGSISLLDQILELVMLMALQDVGV